MIRHHRIIPVLLAGLLTACAGGNGVVVTRTTPTTGDALAISTFTAASAAGPVLLEVYGSPTDDPTEDVETAIVRLMPSPPGHAPVRYTTDPAAAGNPSTRIVLMFGVPQAVDGDDACRAREANLSASAADPGTRTSLQAALCNGADPGAGSQVAGSGGHGTGRSGPARTLVARLA